MKTFYVYQITNQDIPIYIGKGTKKHTLSNISLSRTLESHLKECEKRFSDGSANLKAYTFLKYKEYLSFEIIFDSDIEAEAFQMEKDLINKIGRRDKKLGTLVNLTDGGDGACGFIFPPELRNRLSKIRLGEGNGMYGKNHTNKSKEQLSKTRKEKIDSGELVPHKHSEEHKKKLRENNAGGKAISIRVFQFSGDGEFVAEWSSAAEAANSLTGLSDGTHRGSVLAATKIPYNRYMGFYWRKEDHEDSINKRIYNTDELAALCKSIRASNNSNKVSQLDFNKVLIKEWNSVSEIIRNFQGTHHGNYNKAAANDIMFNGFYWKFNT